MLPQYLRRVKIAKPFRAAYYVGKPMLTRLNGEIAAR